MTYIYEFWLSDVKRLLVHPDALLCTAPPPEQALPAFFKAGFSSKQIARRLNERHQDGFLERKAAMAEVTL